MKVGEILILPKRHNFATVIRNWKVLRCGAGEGWKKISWTDHVRNEEVLLRVNEQRNILHEIRKRKANWIGHILRRNCLLQGVIVGKIKGGIEVTGRRGRKRRKLLDELNVLMPNDPYSGRTAPLTTKRCILYIYSTNTGTEYFKHGIHSPFFFSSSKCSLFHNSNVFVASFVHILYTGCAKIKKK